MFNAKKIKELERHSEHLSRMLAERVTSEKVISKILGKDISWFDFNNLEYAEKITYKGNAKAILRNETFLNEYNKYLEDLITHIAKSAKIDDIPYLRAGIVVLESFKERLESIEQPDLSESVENINEAI